MIPGTRPERRRRRIAREPCSVRSVTSSFVVSLEAMAVGHCSEGLALPCGPPRRYSEGVTPDQELVLLFGGLHLVALMLGCVLFYMFMKSDTADTWDPSDEDEEGGGGGGNDRVTDSPKRPGPGGVPLPDAVQSAQRFRALGKLADRYPWPPHRRAPEPQRTPRRTPSRTP